MSESVAGAAKAPTGVAGLDEMTGGGLPYGRVTLVEGGPGAGKTVLALQTLVNGAREHGEPAIFVAFEETGRRIAANAATFGWDLDGLQDDGLFFLDAQPDPGMAPAGDVDLGGMLAALDAKVAEMGARRVVFDALDVVLAFMDGAAARRETCRLHNWLLERGLTCIITAKAPGYAGVPGMDGLGFMQFMVDCSIELSHDTVQGISQRGLRVVKFRGSRFEENQVPLVIGDSGMEVAYVPRPEGANGPVSNERLSTGIPRLDSMLSGGYLRQAGVLITGAPGTAKTTLCGAFAEAACRNGERTVWASIDSPPDELMRNLSSVGIDLASPVSDGSLSIVPARAIAGSAEIHFVAIRNHAEAHGASCVIIDPVSALAKSGNTAFSHSVIERLVDWAKGAGVTLLCTSLLDREIPETESTPLQISTLADTWIHLSYRVQGGERNRGLSVVKSRGTAHSGQVRELLLDDGGVTLADVYTAGGEVLMGTLRREQEQARRLERQRAADERERQRLRLEAETAELDARIRHLEREREYKQAEQRTVTRQDAEVDRERDAMRRERGRWRHADRDDHAGTVGDDG